MIALLIGGILIGVAWAIDYFDADPFGNPIMTFLFEQGLSALGGAIIARKITKRKRRGR